MFFRLPTSITLRKITSLSRIQRAVLILLAAAITAASAKVIADTRAANPSLQSTSDAEVRPTGPQPLQFGIPAAAATSSDSEAIVSPFKIIQALGFCLGVFLIGQALIRRKSSVRSQAPDSKLQLVAKLALSPKTQLVAVKHNEQSFLLALGEERVTILNSFDDGGILAKLEASPVVQDQDPILPLADITDYSLLEGLNDRASNA